MANITLDFKTKCNIDKNFYGQNGIKRVILNVVKLNAFLSDYGRQGSSSKEKRETE